MYYFHINKTQIFIHEDDFKKTPQFVYIVCVFAGDDKHDLRVSRYEVRNWCILRSQCCYRTD